MVRTVRYSGFTLSVLAYVEHQRATGSAKNAKTRTFNWRKLFNSFYLETTLLFRLTNADTIIMTSLSKST